MNLSGLIIAFYLTFLVNTKKRIVRKAFPQFEYNFEKDVPEFGVKMKEKMFTLKPSSLDLNHGSFGAPPIPVQESHNYYFDLMEKNPESFFRYDTKEYFKSIVEKVANYVGSDPENIVLVENASNGVNSVLRSFKRWSDNDGLLYITLEFSMTKNVIFYIHNFYGVNLYEVELELPINSEKQILTKIEDVLMKNKGRINFAVVDHISASPSIIMPLKKMIELLHSYGVVVFVDGAHAVGQIDINLKDLKPDFYVSNVHKWLMGIQGSSFLYVDPKYQKQIWPSVIGIYNDTFQKRFSWTGTRSWTSFLSIPSAIEFRNWLTNEKVYKYNNDLCKYVGETFSKEWNVSLPVNSSMTASVTNLRIPCNIQEEKGCYDWDIDDVKFAMIDQDIFAHFFTYKEKRYFRLSCQIYNNIDEYIKMKRVFESLIEWN